MALQMEFLDNYQELHAESYWRVVGTNISQSDQLGRIVFYGYPNAESRRVIGEKSYEINAEAYAERFAPNSLNPSGRNPVKAGYEHAKETLDICEGVGEEQVCVSFFKDAKDV